MKALLVFPPSWHPIMPHLALPSLTAYLRASGVQVAQRDLNVEVYDEILSRRHLGIIMRQLQRGPRRAGGEIPEALREQFAWALAEGPAIAAKVDAAKEVLRSPRFYEAEAGLDAFLTANQALDLASLPYHPSSLSYTGFESGYPVDASAALLMAAKDREYNPFYDILQRIAVPQIVRARPDLVGISLTSAQQVVAGLTLAHLLREAGLKAHITVGGKMVTCWRDLLPRVPQLFALFDSAIVYAGERPLLRLIEALDARESLSTVPNLMYRVAGAVQVNEVAPALPVAELPPPDFDGLPLDKYLAPERVLPVSASRGCYWHRCAFCNVGHGESRHYEEKTAERVRAEMLQTAERWESRHLFFCDEAVSPRIFKQLSRLLIAGGATLKWTAAARFERSLDAATLQQMRQAGCRMLMYGLESGAARMLARMNKGTSLDVARRVLRDGAAAGIWNHTFAFFGFPGETLEDAQETVDFLFGARRDLHSVCTGTFLLERHSDVEARPGDYGVTRLLRQRDRDLTYYYDYQVASGLTAEQAEQIEGYFVDSLPQKQRAHIYYHDIYRFLYASQFESGAPLPLLLPEAGAS